jgi:hypothetical protein
MKSFLEPNKYEILGEKYKDEICLILKENADGGTSALQLGFLWALIEGYRKIDNSKIESAIEIGVFSGAASLCMLKAGLKVLYGIDLIDHPLIGSTVSKLGTNTEQERYHLKKGITSLRSVQVFHEKMLSKAVDPAMKTAMV